jgi:hypothetical protein
MWILTLVCQLQLGDFIWRFTYMLSNHVYTIVLQRGTQSSPLIMWRSMNYLPVSSIQNCYIFFPEWCHVSWIYNMCITYEVKILQMSISRMSWISSSSLMKLAGRSPQKRPTRLIQHRTSKSSPRFSEWCWRMYGKEIGGWRYLIFAPMIWRRAKLHLHHILASMERKKWKRIWG